MYEEEKIYAFHPRSAFKNVIDRKRFQYNVTVELQIRLTVVFSRSFFFFSHENRAFGIGNKFSTCVLDRIFLT